MCTLYQFEIPILILVSGTLKNRSNILLVFSYFLSQTPISFHVLRRLYSIPPVNRGKRPFIKEVEKNLPPCPFGHTINFEKFEGFCAKKCGRPHLMTPSLSEKCPHWTNSPPPLIADVFYGRLLIPFMDLLSPLKGSVSTYFLALVTMFD